MLIAACSSVQLAYNNAPLLLQYQMDSYLDLNDEQEVLLAQELKSFHAWHRQDELPVYAQTLRQWAAKLDEPRVFTATELLEKQQQFEQALLTVAERSAYRLAPLVLTLTERQRERLQATFDKSNAEYAKENLDNPESASRERLERFGERYEDWLGSLTKEQRQILSRWLATQPSRAQLWGQERIERQKALLQLLADAKDLPTAEVAAVELHDYFQSLSRYRVTDLQVEREARLLSIAELTANMLNSMTNEQRRHLQERLLTYAADFEALSR
ncbi:MAG: DUF6279 family lipoprotein [Burkholderiaceae bacterium]|nr:DUF6279 family lipoprotein [Burkholderiaceae bacterium]MCD8517165.1 DUF6279 family lipoprotein [Burkholderiaceae bacterium]MCD8536431.1 DUF6279 family lipoprotein [Burkholderiaceae bacterium]MCD8565289.1 DUF6279 family lipoprotein [Burkholderiaceae bacterium]